MPTAKVLLAGEPQSTHKLAETYLAREGVELYFADDHAQALETARRIAPDLILLDMQMPGYAGWKVCNSLKSDDSTRLIPVLAIIEASDPDQKIRAFELGAVDYIPNPCHLAEFQARVRNVLRSQSLINLLAEQAMIDNLTGLHNRRYFEERLPAEIALATRREQPLACIIADLDTFKRFNERHGTAMGDEVLRLAGFILRSNTRAEDIVCRLDGQKFIVLLPQTSLCGASMLAERLRESIEAPSLTAAAGERMPVTASFGVSDLATDGPHEVISAAERALAYAKRSGRNRVQTSAELDPISHSEAE